MPLRADSNSFVITWTEVVTVREITRWQNKSQNGGTKFYCVFRLLVSSEFKLIISYVLLPSTKVRPYPDKQIVKFVFQLFSSQAREINYMRPRPAAARRHRGISKPFAMCELVSSAGCVVMPAGNCCHRQMSVRPSTLFVSCWLRLTNYSRAYACVDLHLHIRHISPKSDT